jgi:phytanoyl-CoA hydroxylase
MTTPTTAAAGITDEQVQAYRRDGFTRVGGVLTPQEAARFREAALRVSTQVQPYNAGPIFTQIVNCWRVDPVMRELTLHAEVAAAAEKLAGLPLRLWHDQILIKQPHNQAPTEFHQDQPYWPHRDSHQPISAWIALCDVPVERGCMTFIPGSHRRTDLPAQRLNDSRSLFSLCPELQWQTRVTVPLKAGDCTFHHGRCAHMATANMTDDPRVAFAIIYMDAGTRFSGQRHVVTNPLNLTENAPLDGELFPRLPQGVQ